MSANSNQSTPAAQTPNSTPPATQQEGTPNLPIQNEATSQPGLSPEEIDARIADGIANGIAKGIEAYNKQQAEIKAAADLAEKDAQEKAQKALEGKKPKSTWPYGNKDKEHEFDLSKMTNWTGLPDDKVLIVLPAYIRDAAGEKIGYDFKNSMVQTVDPIAHKQQITPDKKTGSTTYGLLGYTPIVIHDPSK